MKKIHECVVEKEGDFMTEKEKQKRISVEIKRLNEIFKNLDDKRLDIAQPLINNAAFTRVTLDDLQDIIKKKGCVEEYQNGANQRGFKKTTEADVHIAMTKNLTTIMKQLMDLLPKEQKTESDELMDFLSSGRK